MENENVEKFESMDTDYIAEINKLKQNTVSKDDYNKLREENKKLLNSLVNGETIQAQQVEVKPNVEELIQEVITDHPKWNDLQCAQKLLDLREAMIDSGLVDPWLPQGHDTPIKPDDYYTAAHVEAKLKECINKADNTSSIFLSQLKENMNESAMDKFVK